MDNDLFSSLQQVASKLRDKPQDEDFQEHSSESQHEPTPSSSERKAIAAPLSKEEQDLGALPFLQDIPLLSRNPDYTHLQEGKAAGNSRRNAMKLLYENEFLQLHSQSLDGFVLPGAGDAPFLTRTRLPHGHLLLNFLKIKPEEISLFISEQSFVFMSGDCELYRGDSLPQKIQLLMRGCIVADWDLKNQAIFPLEICAGFGRMVIKKLNIVDEHKL